MSKTQIVAGVLSMLFVSFLAWVEVAGRRLICAKCGLRFAFFKRPDGNRYCFVDRHEWRNLARVAKQRLEPTTPHTNNVTGRRRRMAPINRRLG